MAEILKKIRTAIITGSTRGIGLETAVEFCKNGDNVVIFCRHEDHLQEAIKKVREYCPPEHVLGLTGDVRNKEDVNRIVAQAVAKFRTIDILVNNAGVAIWKEIETVGDEEWENVINTNLRGYFYFIREVMPIMKKQGSGLIINVSSELGKMGDKKYSAYSASKFGINGITKCLAVETKDHGIKIYSVLPGAVDTKLHNDIHPNEDMSKLMTPQYVAERILKLAEGKENTGLLIDVQKSDDA